jgi:hypothetical protein
MSLVLTSSKETHLSSIKFKRPVWILKERLLPPTFAILKAHPSKAEVDCAPNQKEEME